MPRRIVTIPYALMFWCLVFSAYTSTSLLNGRAVRLACNVLGTRFGDCGSSPSAASDGIGNFISRYAVYFRTLGAIYTSKGSVIVCSLLKLGSRGVYVPLDAPIRLFRYFYSAFCPWRQAFALRTLKSGAPALSVFLSQFANCSPQYL